MRKLFICLGVWLSLSPALMAWEYLCQGNDAQFNLSLAEGKAQIKFNNKDIYVVTLEKSQKELGIQIFGYVNHTEYISYSILIKDGIDFSTSLELTGPEQPEIVKMQCQKVAPKRPKTCLIDQPNS